MGLAARFVAQLFGDGTDAALRAQLLKILGTYEVN
jgi:hypothetical protein